METRRIRKKLWDDPFELILDLWHTAQCKTSALLLLAFSLIIYVNFAKILEMQSATLTAGLLLFFFASVAGYLLGGPVRANSRALALMTLVRGGSIAMVIAGQAFPSDPQILVTATVMTAISVVLVVPSALALRRLAI